MWGVPKQTDSIFQSRHSVDVILKLYLTKKLLEMSSALMNQTITTIIFKALADVATVHTLRHYILLRGNR